MEHAEQLISFSSEFIDSEGVAVNMFYHLGISNWSADGASPDLGDTHSAAGQMHCCASSAVISDLVPKEANTTQEGNLDTFLQNFKIL